MSRSRWKFNYLAQDFYSQVNGVETIKEVVVQDRATYIETGMIGYTVRVYNGMKFFNVLIDNAKVGYHLGEFAPSKKKATKKKKVKIKKKK